MSRIIKRIQYDPNEQGANVDIFYKTTVEIDGQEVEVDNLIKKTVFFPASNPQYAALMTYFQNVVNSESPITLPSTPNWGEFNLTVFPSPSYQILRTLSSNLDARNLVENICLTCGISMKDLHPDAYLFLQTQWNLFIEGLSQPPSQSVINEINAVIEQANMRFSLDSDGLMILNL